MSSLAGEVRFRAHTLAPGGLRRRAEGAEQMVEVLDELTNVDELTRLLSRRGLMRALEHHVEGIDRKREKRSEDQELAVVFIDLDKFKKVNDTFGHEVGDQLLVDFAKILKGNLRKRDLVARYGGDEVVLVLPVSGMDDLEQVLFFREGEQGEDTSVIGRVRNALPKLKVKYGLSVGYSLVNKEEIASLGVETAFKMAANRADKMMYMDKKAKRSLFARIGKLFNPGRG